MAEMTSRFRIPLPARRLRWVCAGVLLCLTASVVRAQDNYQVVLDAREALRKKDKAGLVAAAVAIRQNPLAQWVEYWELTNRLDTASADELEAFYTRWPGTYVEDRLRNDWLLELGKRRDWVNFSRDFPRFRMNDDREVTCYDLLTRHLKGQHVRDTARDAWFAQRDADDGCDLMASTLYAAGRFTDADVWQKTRLAIEASRTGAARASASLVGKSASVAVAAMSQNPERYLKQLPTRSDGTTAELATLALLRLASKDPDAAAAQLKARWQEALPKHLAALAWAGTGKQAAQRLLPEAASYYQRAWKLRSNVPAAKQALAPWSDDMLGWQVRSALRYEGPDSERWVLVASALNAMSPEEREDPAWIYWRARAMQAQAAPGAEGEAQRRAARQLLESIAGQMHFYGKLALEDLGGTVSLPAKPAPLSAEERGAALDTPGFKRALLLIDIGLRSEGVREWNFTLRGLDDRQLLAAAQLACDNEVWDRCINTSDRTRGEVDMAQRFPMPFRNDVVAQASEIGLDPAYVYGLIRQESRFIMDARSHVGASGLMQLMPATARWTAKKIGMDYKSSMITDRDVNLKLGTAYLKLVLDDFEGSQTLATAAYNAGPGRPRRWREGPLLEPAAWAENIPFSETRDYVKKVLSNSVYYSALLSGKPQSLKSRLGSSIGPRETGSPGTNKEIP